MGFMFETPQQEITMMMKTF